MRVDVDDFVGLWFKQQQVNEWNAWQLHGPDCFCETCRGEWKDAGRKTGPAALCGPVVRRR